MDCTICGAPFPSEGAEVLELKPCGCLACPRCLMAAHARRGTALLTCRACHDAGGEGVVVTSHNIYDGAASYMRGETIDVVRYSTGVTAGGEGGEGGAARGGIQIFRDANHTAPDLFSLYAGDLGGQVLQYASPSDLCKLDSLNTHFRELMKGVWEKKAYQAYGMRTGKGGWIQGTSFLRDPVFIHIDRMYYAGSPTVTASSSLIAAVSDDASYDDDGDAPEGICLYDARDLSYMRVLDGGSFWNVTICGSPRAEVVVTNNRHFLELRRGGFTRELTFPNDVNRDARGGIPSIGCETHFIAVIGNAVRLFKVTSTPDFLSECQSVLLGRACRNGDEIFRNGIAWGDDETHFIIHHSVDDTAMSETPSNSTITVWHFDSESDMISLRQTIEAGASIRAVALADDYVVGATEDKKIHVWDRHTQEKRWDGLCDIEDEDDQLDVEFCLHPLSLSLHGHMLVSSSHIGCALCVWNIKTGRLVQRCNDADEERFVDMLPDGIDVTGMAHLKQLNGFLCFTGYMNIWCFPTTSHQRDMAQSIRTREEDLRAENLRQWEERNPAALLHQIR